MIKAAFRLVMALLFCLCGMAADAQTHTPDHKDHGALPAHDAKTHQAAMKKMEQMVGVNERLGNRINLDLVFTDENNTPIKLADFITKPTLVLPVYFYCPQACSLMLADLASAVNDVPLEPGKEYRVLAVSFDPDETPDLAKRSKQNYFKIITKAFPDADWRFLTGQEASIRQLLDAMGYKIKKTGPHMFLHPNTLVVLSPTGKVIRYLYGLNFLPFDIGMALTEAEKETPQFSVRKMLTYCFDYDPKRKTYVFKTFRTVGSAILIGLCLFLFFLLRKPKPASDPKTRGGKGDPS